jgi:hypothetical protein
MVVVCTQINVTCSFCGFVDDAVRAIIKQVLFLGGFACPILGGPVLELENLEFIT